MTYLLDANVLIALLDLDHIHYEIAHAWFQREGAESWATCPITQNAVLRIMGNRNYPRSEGPAYIARLLREFCQLEGHYFWSDSLTLLEDDHVDIQRLLHNSQITDTYLLALAASHNAKLATLDRRLVTDAVRQGVKFVHFIQD